MLSYKYVLYQHDLLFDTKKLIQIRIFLRIDIHPLNVTVIFYLLRSSFTNYGHLFTNHGHPCYMLRSS